MYRLFSILTLLLFTAPAEAKNLYVNNSGSPACNNATTYANNDAANPWCLIGRAAWGSTNPNAPSAGAAAVAGDVVLITAGTYTTDGITSGSRWDVALNPANSGTSGNPITFRGVGSVVVRMTASHTGPTIGADGRDYIVWDNITIDDTYNGSVSDSGPVTFHVSIGSQLINSTIQGHNGSYNDGHATYVNNYNAIRLEATRNCRIANNRISRVHNHATGVGNSNSAGVMLYESEATIIEHNEIYDTGTGIYVKGDAAGDGWPQLDTIIRFNRIRDNNVHGVELGASNGTRVYQNILKGNPYAVSIENFASQSANITIQNNTIVSTNLANDAGFYYDGTSNLATFRAFNNIFYGSFAEAVNMGSAATLGSQSFEHNVYNGYDAWGSLNAAQRTFAYWQGTVLQDTVSPAGITSDPLFVDTTDYKLQGGSPALNLGVDILDLDGDSSTSDNVNAGPYLTGNETIGVEAVSTDRYRMSGGARMTGTWRMQ